MNESGYEERARQRVDELKRAGWGGAGSKGWRSLRDGNCFLMVYLKKFDSEDELNFFRDGHPQEIRHFEKVRTFSWNQETVLEPLEDHTGRVSFVTVECLAVAAVGFAVCSAFGYTLGVAAGHGSSEPEPRGCLASVMPGYATGYRAGVIAAAKRVAASEASRGDRRVASQPLTGETGDCQ